MLGGGVGGWLGGGGGVVGGGGGWWWGGGAHGDGASKNCWRVGEAKGRGGKGVGSLGLFIVGGPGRKNRILSPRAKKTFSSDFEGWGGDQSSSLRKPGGFATKLSTKKNAAPSQLSFHVQAWRSTHTSNDDQRHQGWDGRQIVGLVNMAVSPKNSGGGTSYVGGGRRGGGNTRWLSLADGDQQTTPNMGCRIGARHFPK